VSGSSPSALDDDAEIAAWHSRWNTPRAVFNDSFDVRRLLYRVADLHSALAHFVVTKRPDLLQLAVEDLRSTLRQLEAVA
jgi:hypothetical protein